MTIEFLGSPPVASRHRAAWPDARPVTVKCPVFDVMTVNVDFPLGLSPETVIGRMLPVGVPTTAVPLLATTEYEKLES